VDSIILFIFVLTLNKAMGNVKELLEDYQRRLKTINAEIDNISNKNDSNPTYARLCVKASCYRTFITELEKIPVEIEKVDELKVKAINLLKEHKNQGMLQAVKFVKDKTGWGLKESKEYCDMLKKQIETE